MFRLAAILLSSLATSIAVPAAAQSLTLVNLPVVYVASPMVQSTHEGRAVMPAAIVAPPAIQPQVETLHLAAIRPQAYEAATLPAWKAPAFVDRRFRNYNRGLAQYGPFRVLDERRVALVGETDASTPGFFRAMLRDFPALAQLDMVECPGTQDDRANLKLGRMIREAGLVTHVPAIGSVRSGAVELFFAGVQRDIAQGAEFAVHSWMDAYGREAGDFSIDSPENRQYLDYYREMGMSGDQARAFYDFTNSVPHHRALWLDASDMQRWTGRPQQVKTPARRKPEQSAPALAYADVTFS
ncbi:alpha/beta hydrolase [Qipengyuania qiaonensis]|uniref:Alpha/beta hydrolase n=1 Tax=Qipengyuania qiaonensis TaxID=2867240 RepID=A0ABS7J688_9SPHN|nr:alpha/beta hydrolase [Qipengyuania qiaonensis]MBX7482844.1 alpha/beta hydrolase [Qipengyuania qiaonensis]